MVAGACHSSYAGGWGRRVAWTREAEVAGSWDSVIALQPGQQEQNVVSKNKNKQTKKPSNNQFKVELLTVRFEVNIIALIN